MNNRMVAAQPKCLHADAADFSVGREFSLRRVRHADSSWRNRRPQAGRCFTLMKHVLLVDDDLEWLQLNHELLQSHGYAVSTASKAMDALQILLKQDVDAILCDMMMPEMPGDLLYTAIERSKPHLCPRFIAVTGHEGHPKVEDFIQRTRAVVLYKPVSMAKLLDHLERACRQSDAERESCETAGLQPKRGEA